MIKITIKIVQPDMCCVCVFVYVLTYTQYTLSFQLNDISVFGIAGI